MTIRAVVFDLDDTIIREAEVAMGRLAATSELLDEPGNDPKAWQATVLEEARRIWRASPWCDDHLIPLGVASWEGLWSTGLGNHPRLDGWSDWLPAYRRDAWAAALTAAGRDPDPRLAAELADRYITDQRSGHPLIEGSAAAVDAAADRVNVTLLTNGPSDIQRIKLGGTGLAGRFGAITVSGEVGVGKPDPVVFAHAAAETAMAAGELAMVGDSWERDVAGALEAGYGRALWLSHGRPAPDDVPDRVVIAPTLTVEAVELLWS